MGHTTFRNGNLFCLNCGGEHNINAPLPADEMTKKIKAFEELHKDCKKTWTEPIVDPNRTERERALWWNANGERGMSSETMWNCFMNISEYNINHPYDPDDFYRCYKLLEAVPEWKSKLHKLKSLSPAWNNLVENWDKLSKMLEDQLKQKDAGKTQTSEMYDFMRTLIN